MKILGSSCNSSTLKLLAASKVSCLELAVLSTGIKHVGFKGQPILELDSGIRIFSANSGVWYLFRKKFGHRFQDYDSIIDHWLEWETIYLQPAVESFHPLISEKRPENAVILSKLEETLKKFKFIAEVDEITVADICIWSSLHFILKDQNNLFKSFPSIKEWYERISSIGAFHEAVEKISELNVVPSAPAAVGKAKIQHAPADVKEKVHAPVSLDKAAKLMESDSPEPRSATEDEIASAVQNWKLGQQNSPSPRVLKHPVLPISEEKNVFITSALPYVNNVPHLGNIIGCVLSADVFARYCRLRGYNTLYISGTDEYGTATETKALEEGVTPQEICDRYHAIHSQVYKWFNISFDHFGRTSTIQHAAICQQIFSDVHKNGYTFTDSVEQLYCNNCSRFLADRFVEGTCPLCAYPDARGDQCDSCGRLVNANELRSPRCKLCLSAPSPRSSTHLFLNLPKIEPKLREWLDSVVDGWSNNAQVIARSWVKDGLKPRCITRDLKWGIPVPVEGFTNKVFYVWFDAPIGYMSILNCYTSEWEKWWKPQKPMDVKYYQFMAKDNVPFHSIIFPSCLLAVSPELITVNHLMATEYLNYEEGKFSKSRGVGVFGSEAESTGIPADIWRFYLLWVRPENQDSSFVWNDLAQRNNSELLNNLGNFALRALSFLEKNFEGKVPVINIDGEFERSLVGAINKELKEYLNVMENARSLREGLRRLLAMSRHGNLLMQSSQPWVLIKGGPEDRGKCGSVIGLCANLTCLLSMLLLPYMPDTAQQLHEQLNVPPETFVIPNHFYCLLPPGHRIGKPSPLFSKMESARMEELRKRFSGNQKSRSPEAATPSKAQSSKAKESPLVVPNTPPSNAASSEEVLKLQQDIETQGAVVRELKAKGLPKAQWEPELSTLLELKTKLASLDPSLASNKGSGNSGKKGKSKKSK